MKWEAFWMEARLSILRRSKRLDFVRDNESLTTGHIYLQYTFKHIGRRVHSAEPLIFSRMRIPWAYRDKGET